MREYTDLTGMRFGDLTVIQQAETMNQQRRWLCRCDCGGTCVATTGNLNAGRRTNCGCRKSPDLTGKVFGQLKVLGRSGKRNSRGARTTPMWECRCSCGNITYKATDSLHQSGVCMCQVCKGRIGAEIARKAAGFVDGTQITKLAVMKPGSSNTSGCRGVYFDPKSGRYRARLKFRGRIMSFGSYEKYEDAVAARKAAEELYFGAFLKERGTVE